MITYNPKDWFTLIFQFHKSDTFRRLLPTMFLIGLVTAVACWLEQKYLSGQVPPLTIFHQISGFVIALVLVFRINSAYDRWYEGRKLWGSLVNNSRNLAIRLNAMVPREAADLRSELHQLIANFAHAAKRHLRSSVNAPLPPPADVTANRHLSADEIRLSPHLPNLIAQRLTALCAETCRAHAASSNDYLILSGNLGQLTDIIGSCERIRATPIPYSFSLFIKKVIFLYIITMPFTFGLTIGYWAVPIVVIMFYTFSSLELLSEEIEDPFGTDANDLPTDDLAKKISADVRDLLTR